MNQNLNSELRCIPSPPNQGDHHIRLDLEAREVLYVVFVFAGALVFKLPAEQLRQNIGFVQAVSSHARESNLAHSHGLGLGIRILSAFKLESLFSTR
jgi:hypothetical protein